MSSHTRIARESHAGSKIFPYVATPKRTLFSSVGVLVGTGVIVLAFGTAKARAASALDQMAWMPQHAPLTQGTPGGSMAGAVALARAITPGAAQGVAAPVAPVAMTVLPVDVENRVVSQRAQEIVPVVVRPTAPPASAPQRLRSFADAGLVAPAPARVSAPMQVADSVPSAARPTAAEASVPRVGVASAAAHAVSVAAPAVSAMRMPDVQADLKSIRDPATIEPADAAAMDRSASPSARGSSLSAGRAVPEQQNLAIRQGKRNGRSVDESFSDWLDDGAGSRMRNNQPVVPEQAVRAALRNAADAAAARSPTLRQARNDWEAAKFDVDQVKGQRYPQVQVTGNSQSLTTDSTAFNQYNRPTGSIAVTTMIYDWGKTSKSIDSRKKAADAAEFYYEAMAQENAYDVSQNLVELSKNRAIYAIGESYVKRMSQLVDMLVEIVRIDPGRLSELTQAKSRLLQAQTSQEIVATQVRALQLAVNKLVGAEPTPMPGGTQWQFQLDSLDAAVAAVATNPQIEQLTAEAESAKLNAKSVRADGLPKLNWVINKTTASDVFGNRQPWSTMLQLSWTPFQGGSQRAAERASLARADSSSDKRDQLELDSEYKVRDAHRDAIALSTRAKLYGELAQEGNLIRKQFFEQWYHLNRRTLLDVLSAESDFYNNQVSEVTAQFDAYQSVLKLHLNNGTFNEWLNN
jgi:outer membrane protein, adhesin transport system